MVLAACKLNNKLTFFELHTFEKRLTKGESSAMEESILNSPTHRCHDICHAFHYALIH